MEIEVYELKSKIEPFILGKLLTLLAIFIGSFVGLWSALFIFLLAPSRRNGFGINEKRNRTWLDNNWNLISDLILYLAIAIVLYYMYSKIRYGQVDQFTFNDSERKLLVKFKNYFLHTPYSKKYSYDDLNSSIRSDSNLLYGDHLILTIRSKGKRVVTIVI